MIRKVTAKAVAMIDHRLRLRVETIGGQWRGLVYGGEWRKKQGGIRMGGGRGREEEGRDIGREEGAASCRWVKD